jgi:hypothetical protein
MLYSCLIALGSAEGIHGHVDMQHPRLINQKSLIKFVSRLRENLKLISHLILNIRALFGGYSPIVVSLNYFQMRFTHSP